jgi:uncharacterized membrane protein
MERVIHLLGVVLWLGGMAAAGLVRGAESPGQSSTRKRLLNGLAWPGFILTLLGGVGLWMRATELGGWFHVKLTLAAVLLGLLGWMARGRASGAWITPVIVALAAVAITLAELRPF